MDLYQLKFPYRKILEPLGQKLKNIDPDWFAYIALAVAFLTGLSYYFAHLSPHLLLLAIFLIFCRMTLNTLDGVIAIAQGKSDIRGEIVNALPDRYSDVFTFAGIAFCSYTNSILGILGLASVFLVSYTGMLGKAIGVSWQHHGPLGKVERLILIMLASFAQYVFILYKIDLGMSAFDVTMILFILLGQVAVFNRIKGMLSEIKERESTRPTEVMEERVAVVYDSLTGNTQKIANAIASGLNCHAYHIDQIPHPLNYYDLLVIGTPNQRKKSTPKINKLFEQKIFPRSFALFVTYGLPIWGPYSTNVLEKKLKRKWIKNGIKYLGLFSCPGFHQKYKTYKGRPSQKDITQAQRFGQDSKTKELSFTQKISTNLLALLIKTLGRLSKGIRLSYKYGFTSGLMLDYIYKNEPQGELLIGKWIDKAYLENPGWEAIRMRKENLKEHLKQAIHENKRLGKKSVILDVAGGPGRYLMETLEETGEHDIYVICQDIDERWVKEGHKIAAEKGLKNIRFEKGDAFNPELLQRVEPKPNIIVSSGFYDWMTDDEDVRKSIKIIYDLLPAGGKIIYTNQAGHLSMELVSKAFTDFYGKALRMKTRSADLINSWAQDVDFKDIKTDLDKWGLYSVSTEVK